MAKRRQFWNTENVNAYLNTNIDIGNIKNKLMLGYDFHSWEKTKGGGQNQARGYIKTDGSATRKYEKDKQNEYKTIEIDGVTLPKPNVDYFNLKNPDNSISNENNYVFSQFSIPPGLSTVHGIYIQDYISYGRFRLLLSLRHEWYEDKLNYGLSNENVFYNDKLIPRVGLTYHINNNINVYATYLEGFQPQANTTDLMPNTEGFFWNAERSAAEFKPLESDLLEIGVKMELLKKRLLVNMAIYQINQKNILMGDPYNIDALTQRGADRSRGFEIDLTGFLADNWQMFVSYAYINAEIINDNDSSKIGQRKENTPNNSGNLWTRYNFNSTSLLGKFGVGVGINAQGNRIPWFTREFEVPGFVTTDFAIYFVPESNIQIAMNVNNLFDKTYWVGAQSYQRLFPGAPRNFMFSLVYNF